MRTLPYIIIADPDPVAQREILALLSKEFTCIPTSSLGEAWAAINEVIFRYGRIPLLALELEQPEYNSLAFLQFLRTHEDPNVQKILVAILTRRSDLRSKLQAFRAGADDYILKPLPGNLSDCLLLLKRQGHLSRAATLNR